jgi:adenylate kinase
MQPQIFVFMGRSGCGKGTQADLLMKALKEKDPSTPILYLETGKKFREFITGPSFSSKRSAEVYATGERQPDFLAIHFWADFLIDSFEGHEHIVADGTPRSLPEAHLLAQAFNFYHRIPNIIYIDVSRDWAVDRLTSRGRMDDLKPEEIAKRLDWFDTDVMPAVDFFRAHPKVNFCEVKGGRTIEEVHQDLMTQLGI